LGFWGWRYMSKPRNTIQRVIHFDSKAMNALLEIKEKEGKNNSEIVREAIGIALAVKKLGINMNIQDENKEYSLKGGIK
jgi:hypothetical protein